MSAPSSRPFEQVRGPAVLLAALGYNQPLHHIATRHIRCKGGLQQSRCDEGNGECKSRQGNDYEAHPGAVKSFFLQLRKL